MPRAYYFAFVAIFLMVIIFIHRTGYTYTYTTQSQPTIIVEYRSSANCIFDNQDLKQDDPEILKYIREYHLTPPSQEPYKLDKPNENPSEFKSELEKLFKDKRNGFFIECGANDGEYLSNTLALERDQNWTGLLIEANPFVLPNLLNKNRKAWVADVCLSLKPYPQKVKFLHRTGNQQSFSGMGIIAPGPENEAIKGRDPKNYVKAGLIDCFPLFSILSAINVTRVDYFGLDIEGVEFKVIQNIPFDTLDIRVMSIEALLLPEGKPALVNFMKSKGYEVRYENEVETFFVKTDVESER